MSPRLNDKDKREESMRRFTRAFVFVRAVQIDDDGHRRYM